MKLQALFYKGDDHSYHLNTNLLIRTTYSKKSTFKKEIKNLESPRYASQNFFAIRYQTVEEQTNCVYTIKESA